MYSISLEKAEPRSEEGVHKEGEETVIKLVDQEDLRKEREGKLALEEKKAGGQLHSNRLYIGLDENSVLTVMQRRLNLRICAVLSAQQLCTHAKGSRPFKKVQFFLTLFKRPLTPPLLFEHLSYFAGGVF